MLHFLVFILLCHSSNRVETRFWVESLYCMLSKFFYSNSKSRKRKIVFLFWAETRAGLLPLTHGPAHPVSLPNLTRPGLTRSNPEPATLHHVRLTTSAPTRCTRATPTPLAFSPSNRARIKLRFIPNIKPSRKKLNKFDSFCFAQGFE
jgi:hypothetical protein